MIGRKHAALVAHLRDRNLFAPEIPPTPEASKPPRPLASGAPPSVSEAVNAEGHGLADRPEAA